MQDKDKGAKDHRSKSTLFSNDIKQASRAQDNINMCDRSCNLGACGIYLGHWWLTLACKV